MYVVATAGHVDHGKSTLVKALTGEDPDRWEEEKRRGLTIDLGFAGTDLPSGHKLAFVDVPGHVRFLKNMLAGVGGVDACLFVVAATEGWKPQSEEHLRILELLELKHGVIALTNVDQVDDDIRELARLEVDEHVADTFLEDATVVETAAPTGLGIDDLRGALDQMLAATPAAIDTNRPRLWIDRSFAARGSGTVVTGTLTGGPLTDEDELLILPGVRSVRVRALQTLHEPERHVGPGSRVAVNLLGVDHASVGRGDALVRPGQWHDTRTVDATLRVLDSVTHDVNRRGAFVAYIGSGEFSVRVRILGPDSLRPGDEGPVRLHLPVALPLVPGDRFILRESGRSETVGGGEILDVDPQLPASRATPDKSIDRVVAERGWTDVDLLERLTGVRVEPTVGRWVISGAALEQADDLIVAAVRDAGPLGLGLAALDDRHRALLDRLDGVEINGGRVRMTGGSDPLAAHPYAAALAADPFAPPGPEGVDRGELRELVRRGDVIEQDGIFFAPSAIDEGASIVAGMLADQPDGVTVSAVREALGSTRKFTMPLLAHFDRTGRTRRRGDVRIAGPRLETPGQSSARIRAGD